jgi:hypothetical protein
MCPFCYSDDGHHFWDCSMVHFDVKAWPLTWMDPEMGAIHS